jgi:hypothetical protein
VVKIDGHSIGAQGTVLSVTRYLDGEVG